MRNEPPPWNFAKFMRVNSGNQGHDDGDKAGKMDVIVVAVDGELDEGVRLWS